jgi:arylsulfatase A-like enzyme
VTLVDKWLGYFFEKLEALKLWDDTIVVVTCDHGTQLNEHSRFGKSGAELHPFNTRIVWTMWHPDGPRGQHVAGFVQNHDLLPTLLHLVDIPYANHDGLNIWPLVTRDQAKIRDHVVIGWSEFSEGNATARCSVRDDSWNYVVAVGREDPEPELYDLEADPDEISNVHDQHPDVVAKQRARLEAVVGQPLPGQLNEVCDRYLRPFNRYWQLRA